MVLLAATVGATGKTITHWVRNVNRIPIDPALDEAHQAAFFGFIGIACALVFASKKMILTVS